MTAARKPSGGSGAGPSRPGPAPGIGWRDGVFLGLAAAAFAATAAQAGELLGSGSAAEMLAAVRSGHLVELSGTILIGVAALLGSLLLRLRWQIGLAAVGVAWWCLVAFALWQERVMGASAGLPLPSAALAAVYGLALLLRPADGAKAGKRQPAAGEAGETDGRARPTRLEDPLPAEA